MTGIPDSAQIEVARAATQAELESEAKKQSAASVGDATGSAADIGGNVMMEGVGEVAFATVGAVVEGIGSVVGAAAEGAAVVVGGLFEGLGS